VTELTTENHEVIHRASNRRAGYGSLVAAAGKLEVPKPDALRFKAKNAYKYVGKERPIYDLPGILNGQAQFGLDIFRDGMVHASIEHPPVYLGKVKSLDDKAAKSVKGVRDIVQIDPITPPYLFKPLGGVAVIGDNTWAVFQGRKQLRVEWEDGPHASFTSPAFRESLIETVHKPAKVMRNFGNVDTEFAKGGRIVEATYTTPLAAHASMEPPAAVAEYRNGIAEIWAPTQNPQAVQDTVAQALGIDKKNVICHVTLLGGAFGRKSKPDYCAEAAILAKKLGKPVKVVWTREDDLTHDYYHSTSAVYHKASLDAKGRPTAWLARSAFPPIAAMFDEKARTGAGFELDLGLTDNPFDVPNMRAENGEAEAHVRIGWFRAVCNNWHAFALHSFADELAHAANRDSLEYLLDLIGPGKILDLKAQGVDYSNYGAPLDKYPVDTRRLRKVLEVAGEKSGWGKRRSGNGWGMGIAAHRSFNTYVASVVEVEIDKAGTLKIPRVEQVVDCGFPVNPDRVRSQIEGAAAMAVSLAKLGEITALNGRVQQTNFHQFNVARMPDAPRQTNVTFVETDNLPTGVGEPGLPPVMAALTNAIFAATGKRIRDLPIRNTKLV
jgi:isoquinoline 1-oxidoreductase beta subunit